MTSRCTATSPRSSAPRSFPARIRPYRCSRRSGCSPAATSCGGAAALRSWGWRVPFVAGALIAVYSFVLRRTLSDEPPAAHAGRPPIVEAVREHWRAMLQAAGLSLINAVAFYTVFVYVVTYIELFDRLP